MEGWTDGRTDVHDIMAIKPNFLTSMGYHIFLAIVLRTRSSTINGGDLSLETNFWLTQVGGWVF